MFSDMIDCARNHILNFCDQLHKSRKHVFSEIFGDDFGTSNFFSPDFVKMKYDHNKIGRHEEMLVEDGEHFGMKELIDSITSGAPYANYLLEVGIFSFHNCHNVISFMTGTRWQWQKSHFASHRMALDKE
jgi:hypothetical protein